MGGQIDPPPPFIFSLWYKSITFDTLLKSAKTFKFFEYLLQNLVKQKYAQKIAEIEKIKQF